MELTTNQKALLRTIGLEVKKDLDGVERIVTPKGTVPNGTEIADIYYPSLFQKVISQEVTDSIRGGALLEGVFLEEEWINGIKEFLFAGSVALNDYDKVITIDDFNPADPSQYSNKYSIDFSKYSNIKIDMLNIIQAFTTPGNLERFVNVEIKRLSDSFIKFIQDEKAKIIANDPAAVLSIAYDNTYDVSGITTEEILRQLDEIVESLKTLSADHLALVDNTVLYSASVENLVLVMTPFFKSRIDLDVMAKLFGPNSVVSELVKNAQIIDLAKAGVSPQIASNFRMALFDKDTLKLGYQLKNRYWTVNVPKGQQLQELHNWFGFAYLPNFIKYIWTVNPAPFKKITGIKQRLIKLQVQKENNKEK